MKPGPDKPSLRNIALRAGVSLATTSYVLRNKPGPSPETRERVLRVARELGYAPDARIDSWMARVRDATSKDLLPIAWLNTSEEKDAWQRYPFHTPYLEGARARALELGYKVEEIWCGEPGMTMRRLGKILYQRGIEGSVVCFPARHLRVDWNHLAAVSLGASLLAPRLHRILADVNFNLQLALKSLRRLGYRRIGICLAHAVDRASHFTIGSTVREHYYTVPSSERIPPLFHAPQLARGNKKVIGAQLAAWLELYKPEVIVGHDNRILQWVESAGYRVPDDIGIVHLAIDDDVLDWAGIYSRRREIGATAIEQVVMLMRNHQYGVPKTPLTILIQGSWQSGRTLKALP